VREVRLAPEADAVLNRLWSDGHASPVERLEDAIDLIAEGDPLARQHRLTSSELPEGLWLIVVRHQGQTWVIVWGETAAGAAKVHAVSRTAVF
jgi:hypothetical protein